MVMFDRIKKLAYTTYPCFSDILVHVLVQPSVCKTMDAATK